MVVCRSMSSLPIVPSLSASAIRYGLFPFVLVILGFLTMAGAAIAAPTVYVGGSRLVYKAAPGATNRVEVTRTGDSLTITDSTSPITVGSPCLSISPTTAQCPTANLVYLSFLLGDQNDSILFGSGIPNFYYLVNGGPGSDEINASSMTGEGNLYSGGGEIEWVFGGQGSDRISTGDVLDAAYVVGDGGDDEISATGQAVWDEYPNEAPSTGGSEIHGGPGNDQIDTTGMSGDVWITLHEGDDYVYGGPGREYVRLDEGAEFASTGGGDDYFLRQHLPPEYPESGDDYIEGGEGSDQLLIEDAPSHVTFDGGDDLDWVDYFRWNALSSSGWSISQDNIANDGGVGDLGDNVLGTVEGVGFHLSNNWGPDHLVGGPESNTLNGQFGNDYIDGAGGSDTLSGGKGADTIYAVDGEVDTVSCGNDPDSATVDSIDIVSPDCETVTVEP